MKGKSRYLNSVYPFCIIFFKIRFLLEVVGWLGWGGGQSWFWVVLVCGFFKKKNNTTFFFRVPLSVNLKAKNLAKEMQKHIQGTTLPVTNKGCC